MEAIGKRAIVLEIIWTFAVLLLATVTVVIYLRGWFAQRRSGSTLANRARLAAFSLALLLWLAAFVWPLPALAETRLLARTAQLVFVALLGAPIFWLSASFHVMTPAMPRALRICVTRLLVRPSRMAPLLAGLTSPFIVWFVYLAVVLMWHDPSFVAWSTAAPWRTHAQLLPLLLAALLFWQQITRMGPRRYTKASPFARFAMLVGVEIPNVVAGITIAFRTTPLYGYYAFQEPDAIARGSALSQQTVSGALVWVFGSLVYIVSIVLVVNEIFRREGSNRPEPPIGWDADERFIAPGLEGRLKEATHTSHNWRDH